MNIIINIKILKEKLSGDFKTINNDIKNDFKHLLYVEAKNDFLYIKQNQVNFQIDFQIPIEVKKNGFFIIKTDIFNTIINTSSGENMFIKIKDNIICFQTKTNKTEIKTINITNYPDLFEKINLNKEIKIKNQLIVNGIKNVYQSASMGVINPQLSSVFVVIKNKIIEFFSTDTFVVSEYKTNTNNNQDLSFILPVSNALIISDALSKNKQEYIYINKQNKNIIFHNEFVKIYSSTIETEFLDYKTYFKTEESINISFKSNKIIDFFTKAKLFSNKTNSVKIKLDKNKLNLSVKNKEIGTTEEEIQVFSNTKNTIDMPSYNYFYLLKCIKILKSDDVVFLFNQSNKSLIITNKEEEIKSIVAPQNN